jgi:AraC family transcriptional regulator
MSLLEGVAERRYQPHERQRTHEHPYASVTLVLAGSLEETVGRRTETALALGVVVKPAGVAHEDRFGDAGALTVQVRLESGTLPHDTSWRWSHGGRAAAALLSLFRRRRTGVATDDDHECLVTEALAALDDVAPPGRNAPRWLERVRETVDDADPGARVADLARAAGVHPVYLARQFRRFYGETVSGALKRRRLCRAASFAAAPGLLTAAAHEAGYADLAHLCREFRSGTGLTPGAYKRLVANLQAPAARPD